ncbi:MAG: polysaccharide deacetylase family protein [Pseudomonadota bacterium]
MSSGGVCLSYDDWFVDEWSAAAPIFEHYGARATFYVARMESLTPRQIDKLLDLQKRGHEIGSHTSSHAKAASYLLTRTVEQYMNEEVDRGLAFLRSRGFKVTSFAYPHHEFVTMLDPLLLERFDILRYRWDGPLLQDRLYEPGTVRVVNVAGSLDLTGTKVSSADTDAILRAAQQAQRVAVFCGHNIGSAGPKGTHYCTQADLETFIADIARRDLKFHCVREMAAGC